VVPPVPVEGEAVGLALTIGLALALGLGEAVWADTMPTEIKNAAAAVAIASKLFFTSITAFLKA
jgi:hypothetical protein